MPWLHELKLLSWDHKEITAGVDTDGDLGIEVETAMHEVFSIIIRHDQVDKFKKWLYARGEFKCLTCNGSKRVPGSPIGRLTTEDIPDAACPDCKTVPVKAEFEELRQLTNSQAVSMRQFRIHTVRLDLATENIVRGVCALCEHDPVDSNCPSCALWNRVCDLKEQVAGLCKEYDRLLQAGPAPKVKK